MRGFVTGGGGRLPMLGGATEMRPWLDGPEGAAAIMRLDGGPSPTAPPERRRGLRLRLAERLDEAHEHADGVLLREHAGATDEALVVLRRLDQAVRLEGEVAEDHERVGVRRVELDRLLRRGLGLVRVDELRVVDLRELGVEARLREIALGVRELALDEADDAEPVAAMRVRLAERGARRRVLRVRVERELVALDRAVLVAARLEESTGAHPLLGLRLGRRGLGRERLDRGERRVRVAAHLAEVRERLEGAGVRRLGDEDLLVGLRRALGRADLLGERARLREEQLDLAVLVGRDARVLVVERDDRLPLVERAVVARERGERAVVRAVDREDGLEGLGRARRGRGTPRRGGRRCARRG